MQNKLKRMSVLVAMADEADINIVDAEGNELSDDELMSELF